MPYVARPEFGRWMRNRAPRSRLTASGITLPPNLPAWARAVGLRTRAGAVVPAPGTAQLVRGPGARQPTRLPSASGYRTRPLEGVAEERYGGEFWSSGLSAFRSPFEFYVPLYSWEADRVLPAPRGLGGRYVGLGCGPACALPGLAGVGQINLPIVGAVGVGTLALVGAGLWLLTRRRGPAARRRKLRQISTRAAYEAARV